MSLYLGDTPIAGLSERTKYNAHHLLDFKWSDCIMNDVSWLRADTFSWQSGDVYVAAYNHLVADLQGITSETETIGSYTITFYRADDNHKIVLADQETTVANIYSETGIAWYYIVDTNNTRFKLPRSTYNAYSKKLPVIGNGMTIGLTDGTVLGGMYNDSSSALGAYPNAYGLPVGSNFSGGMASYKTYGLTTDATKSGIIAQSETLDNMYLYFYVGDFSQTAVEQTAGLNSSLFNGKADVDLSNTSNKLSDLFVDKLTPDYTAGVDISSYTSSANQYIAPCAGIIYADFYIANNGGVYIDNIRVSGGNGGSNVSCPSTALISKESTVYISYPDTRYAGCHFYPLKGVN